MHDDERNDAFVDVHHRLEQISTTIDKQIASDDPEVSYAATTAALHLHAAQAELAMPGLAEIQLSTDGGESPADRAVDALNNVVTTINDRKESLPAEHQTALARVAIHLAEARDALSGRST